MSVTVAVRPRLFGLPAVVSPPQQVVDAWNAMADRTGLPKVRLMPPSRSANLRLRLQQVGPDVLLEAIARVGASAFCQGDNDRGWRADIDFVLQPKSLTKLLEHGYQYQRRDRHQESVNGAAIALARMDAEGPLIEGRADESD